MDLHEQERLRVQAEAPREVGRWVNDLHALIRFDEREAERARVLALMDRELEHVRLADGQLGDVLRALRKDVEEGVVPQVHPEAPLVDQSTDMVTKPRAAAEEG